MKESLRRVILFTVIVVTGSVMILFDVPLIFLIPLIVAIGCIILVLLGAITVADIRSVLSKKISQKPKKTGIIHQLDEMKSFEKKPGQPAQPDKKTVPPEKKEEPRKNIAIKTGAGTRLRSFFLSHDSRGKTLKEHGKQEKKGEPKKSVVINTGAVAHLRSFLSSLGSLGTILKERSKQERKVEHINQLLDKTVSEKVKDSALSSAGNGAGTIIPPPGSSGGPGLPNSGKDQDPFLSLSSDEFDASLLEGLDGESPPSSPAQGSPLPPEPAGGPAQVMNDPGIPLPSLDINSEAEDILKGNAESPEEFKGLEGAESIDQDVGDLDNLNFDEVDLDIDIEEDTPAVTDSPSLPESSSSPPPEGNPAVSPAPPSKTTVKTDWIASDAPKDAANAENEISTLADMASFAGGASGSDEDLLSSLASDVKHVTKEKNTSLLRELKDFKAPAADIDTELKDTYAMMKAIKNPAKKATPPKKGTK